MSWRDVQAELVLVFTLSHTAINPGIWTRVGNFECIYAKSEDSSHESKNNSFLQEILHRGFSCCEITLVS